jgi:hypothetical protein
MKDLELNARTNFSRASRPVIEEKTVVVMPCCPPRLLGNQKHTLWHEVDKEHLALVTKIIEVILHLASH